MNKSGLIHEACRPDEEEVDVELRAPINWRLLLPYLNIKSCLSSTQISDSFMFQNSMVLKKHLCGTLNSLKVFMARLMKPFSPWLFLRHQKDLTPSALMR